MSKIKVNSIEAATGSTITIPSGQTLDISSTTLTLPSTVVTTTGTQTLTNKTLTSPSINTSLSYANQGEVRFLEATANGSNYVGFKAASSLSADKIWTLPTADGSANQAIITDGSGTLSFGTLGSKFVSYQYYETYSTSSHSCNNADSDTTLAVSITPSSTSNKILVVGKICTGTSASFGGFGMYLKRGSTIIGTPTSGGSGTQQRYHSNFINPNGFGADEMDAGFFFFLDSPSTTSSTTYTVSFRGVSGVSTIYMNRNNGDTYRGYSSIMAIELQP